MTLLSTQTTMTLISHIENTATGPAHSIPISTSELVEVGLRHRRRACGEDRVSAFVRAFGGECVRALGEMHGGVRRRERRGAQWQKTLEWNASKMESPGRLRWRVREDEYGKERARTGLPAGIRANAWPAGRACLKPQASEDQRPRTCT